MPRFPIAARDKVPTDQVAAFDAIVSSRGGAVPEFGPIAVQLHVPEIAQRGRGAASLPPGRRFDVCPTTWLSWR